MRPFSTATSADHPLLTAGAALLLAATIFIVDAFTPLGMAVAVLYVLVVLIATKFCDRQQLIAVALACGFLTLLAFGVSHGVDFESTAFARCLISLAAIAITTLLVLQNKAAEQSLREQANLLDVTHDAIIVRDRDDIIRYWNRGAEQLYGWPGEEARGRRSHELLKAVFPLPLASIKDVLDATGKWEGEVGHTRRDGSSVVVASRWSLQRDARGEPMAVLETNNDVSQQRRAEDDLRQAQANLAHVNRVSTLGEMTASIAHEVSQPIAAIVASAGAASRWLAAGNMDEVKQSLARISRDGHRASDVIGRIRAMAMKLPPRQDRVRINEAIREVLMLTRGEAERARAQVRTDLAGSLPAVAADRVQIQQVLLNLVVNAFEAMSADDAATRELIVSSRSNGDGLVEVSVRDSGPGFTDEQLGRVFDAFYTTKSNGIGMGLAICKSIVEAHEGRLWAEKNAPRGAAFRFTLPIMDAVSAGRSQ